MDTNIAIKSLSSPYACRTNYKNRLIVSNVFPIFKTTFKKIIDEYFFSSVAV